MAPPKPTPTLRRRIVEILVVAVLYHVGAQLGFLLESLGTLTSPVWPPSGIAFAALLLLGRRVWPGIFIGAFSANLTGFLLGGLGELGGSTLGALAIAAGNTLEGVVGLILLRRFVTRDDPFETASSVLGFVVVTAVMCAVGATNGVTTLALTGVAQWAAFGNVWLTWWLGDATGVLILTPLAWVWFRPLTPPLARRSTFEAFLVMTVVLGVCCLIFGVPVATRQAGFPLTFLLLPPLLWATYRFEQRGATLGIVAAAMFSVWATSQGFGPFAVADRNESLLLLQGFIGVASITMLVMASAVHERRVAMHAIQASQHSLLQSQKMEAVGRLAGGIAHDFNNLLMVIGGHADLLLGTDKTPEQWRSHAKRIQEASRRGAALVKQLLAYSRRQVLLPRAFNLNELVNDMGQLLLRVLGEQVELVIHTTDSGTTVHADANNIERVLLNLSINARDAMPDGGTLTIETERTELSEETATSWELTPGPYVIVAVTDSGIGMDATILADIFDPFFTTKDPSAGTGLGLATAYGIVRQSGGHIDVQSAPGRGTTFRVYLPLSEAVVATSDPSGEGHPLRSARGTILLAEDNGEVRALVSRVLTGQGYTVVEACDGIEAQELYQKNRSDILAVVTDVVMPRMNGRDLAAWVRTLDPRAKVLLISGHTDGQAPEREWARPGTAFLQKPFSSGALLSKLEELFDI